MDFLIVSYRTRKGEIEIYPKFIIGISKDLMIRGSDFYAFWNEKENTWSTSEQDLVKAVDAELDAFAEKNKDRFADSRVHILHMWDAESGSIDIWHRYCQKQMRDNFKPLDNELVFSNQKTTKEDYSSHKLPYPLESGSTEAYDELVSELYTDEQRHKFEWAIGAIVTGASKKTQKFIVFYGPPGTGKSTILDIIQSMFDGYCSVFDAESLGSSTATFALEQLKTNPLVAISQDGDLSRIERNTTINSLVSHEKMTVNEKHKSIYSMKFNTFLFMGTNKPVKITDAKSGILRRLIDVQPTGNRISLTKYDELMNRIKFEYGAIAYKCKEIYLKNPNYYQNYKPTLMMGESNDFYNFIEDSYDTFQQQDSVSLKQGWEMYKTYCDNAKVPYPMSMRIFKNELKNYFKEYKERVLVDGVWIRSYYIGFKTDILDENQKPTVVDTTSDKIVFKEQHSRLDDYCKDYPAQYATEEEVPGMKWSNVRTTLKDLDTRKLHYVKVPEKLIVIDFDIKGEDGKKSFKRNLEEASKWPKTYAELSKSGAGIHLHYIYTGGDPAELSRIYSDNVEVKVFTGNSALRRKLTKCNDEDIATISSGLPLREKKEMINFKAVANEKALRTLILRNLNKEYCGYTKPSVDFIYDSIESCYKSGMTYDVSDLHNAVVAFAAASTHQSDYCLNKVAKIHWKSDSISDAEKSENAIVFFDVEVFPNLFLLNYKKLGSNVVNRMINPKPEEIQALFKYRLVGFNCRRYDNHIVYARGCLGWSNEQLFRLSQSIIMYGKGFFGEAYNISYTDIYDYAAKKQSLKKWEIELGIHHQELGYPWDQPVPEDKWQEVAEYCDNDVNSTEAVWNATKADFEAREILADLAGMTVNDTTNSLTTKIIFGNEKHPQLNYEANYEKLKKDFPGYEFVKQWNDEIHKYEKHNMYRGIDLGFGGYVYSEPGMYGNVALLDVASLHPHSIIAMNLFGDYTKKYAMIVDIRIHIKHGEYDVVKKEFDGKLAKYLDDPTRAKKLSQALKIAINSVYGLTSAAFDNPFRVSSNEMNIVALRGALFMKTLQDNVAAKGFKVAHIKTDSIKIPDATPEIIDYCMKFAQGYGYTFEHEATYDRMCLVNDSTYIAKYAPEYTHKDETPWTATGLQFQIPYIFKKCFSHEQITAKDMCETKEVKTAMYLDMNEGKAIDEHDYKFIGRVGLFCPIKPGHGGGILYREQKKKDGSLGMNAVTGTKGYRWIESENVLGTPEEQYIDKSYYETLVNEAIDTISQYGNYEWFVSDDPYIGPKIVDGKPVYPHIDTII